MQGALIFFLLSLGGEGFFFFFPWFPMCSHYVPLKFPSGCQYVPQVPNVFPNMFSIAPHLYPHMLWQMLSSFHLQVGEKGGGTLYFKIEAFILGCIGLLQKGEKKKKMKTWKAPHLIKVTCCVRLCICDLWTQRKVKVDAEKSDGKKKSDGGRREK